MSWLLRDGEVLAALEPRPADWGSEIHGAVLVPGPALVHTLAKGVALDVASCAEVAGEDGKPGLEVRRVATLRPRRLARPKLHGGCLIVAGAGAFERWRLQVGDRLEIREA